MWGSACHNGRELGCLLFMLPWGYYWLIGLVIFLHKKLMGIPLLHIGRREI